MLWLVMKQGIVLTLAGSVAGLAGGLGLWRLLASLTPNLPPAEIGVVLATATVMMAVALAAIYIPARRAATISPMRVLRHE